MREPFQGFQKKPGNLFFLKTRKRVTALEISIKPMAEALTFPHKFSANPLGFEDCFDIFIRPVTFHFTGSTIFWALRGR